ncbi:type II toxin-antitoxin system RelE/ParE family toxin [Paenibacillus konkukensis]|uniref:type II toxin-antitoxin system RelE/ParE family toxin n=1 Tax=Paenibacillus konkukensis TaxID=2020716 RepID=UPI00201D32AA|nr:type II toxin-antitoxin system RelE/ParE family toxin [Paenibacillus konkukensis]
MLPITYLGPAERYFKKLVEKPLKRAYFDAILAIRNDPSIGEQKTGDLTGIFSYDVSEENDDGELVVVIMAGSRENFACPETMTYTTSMAAQPWPMDSAHGIWAPATASSPHPTPSSSTPDEATTRACARAGGSSFIPIAATGPRRISAAVQPAAPIPYAFQSMPGPAA